MKRTPIVALIGQTNAGKSSLLNRLARRRIAIVAREEGTTRDNVMARIDDRFLLIDTAGLKDPTDDFEAGIQDQIADAIDSADLILFVLDSTKPFDHHDKQIARSALRSKKPVFMLLNKSDSGDALDLTEFRALGIDPKNTYRTSATTGAGTSELKDAILNELFVSQRVSRTTSSGLSQATAESERGTPVTTGRADATRRSSSAKLPAPLKIALIGRPNVGKSSLFNTLGKKQQALVSSRQGTTRDINRVEVRYEKRTLEILDTAGLRRPGKREVGIEKFSALRTLAAIEEADICALLVDATEPHAKLDQSLAGQIVNAGKGIIIVLTKTDLVDNTDEILDDLERDFNFLPYAPVLLTSSETGSNVTRLFSLALDIDATRHVKIPTAELNKILNDAIISHPPAGLKNTRPKPKYIVQTDICPPWFVVHGHDLGLLHWSYKRFLERKIREKFPFVGTPIFFSFITDNPKGKQK